MVGVVNTALIGFGVLVLGIALYALSSARQLRNRGDRIADATDSTEERLQPGPTTLAGTVAPTEDDELLASPVSSTDAIATDFEVRGLTERGGSATHNIIYERTDAVPFVVTDGTSAVRVDPTDGHIEFDPERYEAVTVTPGEDPPPEIRHFLDATGAEEEASVAVVSGKQRRVYYERVIAPGDDVVVHGDLRRADASWDGPEHVIDAAPADGEFVISNKPDEELRRARSQYGTFMYVVGGVLALVGVVLVLAGLLV